MTLNDNPSASRNLLQVSLDPGVGEKADSGDFAQIERFQALEPGSYWRYTGAEPAFEIRTGDVLLMLDVECFEDLAHTIVMRSHPRAGRESSYKFLVEEFLNNWQYEPDGDAVRERELAQLQGEITQAQQEMLDAQVNPKLVAPVVAERLLEWEEEYALKEQQAQEGEQEAVAGSRAPTNVDSNRACGNALMPAAGGGAMAPIRTELSAALSGGVSASDVRAVRREVERQAVIAETKARWLEGKVAVVTQKVGQMAPFFKEKAAVALARTKGVRRFAEDLMKGLQTLNLYTGVGVEVHPLVTEEASDADANEPLTLFQRKLFLDEELAAFVDVNETFDFGDMAVFEKIFASEAAFREQLLPAPRGVVSVAIRRKSLDYGDAYVNAYKNEINKRVFLLVRNGGNFYRVHSAEPSHERTPNLFPTRDDADRPFRGIDGSRIKFQDIRFTEAAKAAKDVSLHYKRFLVLLAGLDHRLGLFGHFHDQGDSLGFISLAFQERYMRFVADGEEDRLIGAGRPDVFEWIRGRNAYLQPGSRIITFNTTFLNPQSAPGVVKTNYHSRFTDVDWVAHPLATSELLVVRRDGRDLVVDVRCTRDKSGRRGLAQAEFNARVDVRKGLEAIDTSALCLDAVDAQDLDWYVRDRASRVHHIEYIRMFKRTSALLKAEEQRAAPAMEWLREAVRQGRFCAPSEMDQILADAVRSWRCANRGRELPSLEDKKAFDTILSLAHSLASEDSLANRVTEWAAAKGYTPLRAVITGKNKLAVYVEALPNERDERLMPWGWVKRIGLDVLKTKLTETSSRWVWLEDKPDAKETELRTWEGLQQWVHAYPEPIRPDRAAEAIAQVEVAPSALRNVFRGPGAGIDEAIFPVLMRNMLRVVRRKKGYLMPVTFELPIAVYAGYNGDKKTWKGLRWLTVSEDGYRWIAHFASPAQREQLRQQITSLYREPDSALERAFRTPFTPRFVFRKELPEVDADLGIYIAGDTDEFNNASMTVAQSGFRDEKGAARYKTYWFDRDQTVYPRRSLDAAMAFWLADKQPEGCRFDSHAPRYPVTQTEWASRWGSVAGGDHTTEGPLSEFFGAVFAPPSQTQ